jgi:hypothetical protein
MLGCCHGGNGHQVFELRGIAVVAFHKAAKSSASLRDKGQYCPPLLDYGPLSAFCAEQRPLRR